MTPVIRAQLEKLIDVKLSQNWVLRRVEAMELAIEVYALAQQETREQAAQIAEDHCCTNECPVDDGGSCRHQIAAAIRRADPPPDPQEPR